MKFDALKDYSQPLAEEKVLTFWDQHDVFHRAQSAHKDKPHFVFYEGPPTANGRPGIHHVISRTVKDLVCRYKYMQGFQVNRKGGWDTHGLPVEIEVEKKLGLTNKNQILEYGVDKFVDQCRHSVFTYIKDWDEITRRIGYWLDLKDAYVTLHNEYIESVWWILKNYFDQNLLYKGFRTVPFCPRCGTGLSSHEVAQGYDIVKDPSVYVKVRATDGDFSYLVWTTTPWTLPSNAALCMHPEAWYVMVEHEGERLVLAEALVPKLLGDEKEILDRKLGKEYLTRKYVPLFDTFANQVSDRAFYVINAEFVTLEDGTGIVHIAPGYGADDYEIGRVYDLPVLQAVEANGLFSEGTGPYAGMYVKDADPVIIKDLKIAGRLFKKEIYEHNYPFCWRCDSPLIYIARQSWYLKTTQFRDQLIKNNNAINWVPDEIRTGRMGNWLENNVDWALSRERFWGTPLPIWICDDARCGKMRAVGSVEQLLSEAASDQWQTVASEGKLDLHKPMIDEIKLRCECGGSMTRVPELIDGWFDSGSMPFAQWHYPFENREKFKESYPADFISEAVDQTRGWFYSLLAISTMLSEVRDDLPRGASFKNVVVLEFILDKVGKKMSKHKGNVVDPFATVAKYGADPVRWYLVANSNLWLPTNFDEDALGEVVRKYFDTLRNTYSFFALYANIDDIVARANAAGVTVDSFLESRAGASERMDRWVMSRYHSLVRATNRDLDRYEITRPVRQMQSFVIDDLSNWYVRLSRRRFWASNDDPSKMRAYLTLWRILEGICRLSAPVTPFTSELIWQELVGGEREKSGSPLSVHMCNYPKPDESQIDGNLEEVMDTVREIVSLGRAARSRRNLKVRQPLAKLMVGVKNAADFDRLAEYSGIIKDELNVKEVVPSTEVNNFVTYSAKLNFKAAGPKLGGLAKAAQTYVTTLGSDAVRQFEQSGKLNFQVDGAQVVLAAEDVEIQKTEKEGFAVESNGPRMVALETALTQDLIDEGFARELVNKIQNMRKSSGFDVTDHITVSVRGTAPLRAATGKFEEFIRQETLARSIEFLDNGALDGATQWNINGEQAEIAVRKL